MTVLNAIAASGGSAWEARGKQFEGFRRVQSHHARECGTTQATASKIAAAIRGQRG